MFAMEIQLGTKPPFLIAEDLSAVSQMVTEVIEIITS